MGGASSATSWSFTVKRIIAAVYRMAGARGGAGRCEASESAEG
jgi:hypothetical protein